MILFLKGDIKMPYFVTMNLAVNEFIRMCNSAQLSAQLGLKW